MTSSTWTSGNASIATRIGSRRAPRAPGGLRPGVGFFMRPRMPAPVNGNNDNVPTISAIGGHAPPRRRPGGQLGIAQGGLLEPPITCESPEPAATGRRLRRVRRSRRRVHPQRRGAALEGKGASVAEHPERIPVVVAPEPEDVARRIARRIAEIMREQRAAGRHAVLGLASGSTPIGIYRELARLHRDEGLDFSDVVTFNLDEYVPMAPDSLHSFRRFMAENLFDRVNIEPRNIHIPRGDLPRAGIEAHCEAFERAIVEAGGIDFQILGIGQ